MQAVFIASSLWQQLELWDKRLFIKLNSEWTNPVFDTVLPYFRDSVLWAPLYLFVLAFVALNYGKKGWWWSLAFVCTIALADITSSRVIKETIERLRPCNDPFFFDRVRLLIKACGSGYSFTSSHAANHFGMATFVSLTFYPTFKKWIYLTYVWAAFIAYAQVYVGVHFPLDIMGGALLGVLAGLLTASVFTAKVGTFNLAI